MMIIIVYDQVLVLLPDSSPGKTPLLRLRVPTLCRLRSYTFPPVGYGTILDFLFPTGRG